jgi:hypothetical protein
MCVELFCVVVQSMDQYSTDPGVLRDCACTTHGILQQSSTQLETLGTLVYGEPGQYHHRHRVWHVASDAACGICMRYST